MIKIIKSENLKYRRTFTKRLILLAPMFFVIIALLQKLFLPTNYLRSWQLIINQVYNWWPVIFIPLGSALFAALVSLQEKKAGNYYNLRIHSTSPSAIWTGKIVLMAYHTLLTTLVLICAIMVSGLITADGEIPWVKILAGGLIIWITSLSIIPIQLWAAMWKGTFFSITVGFVGLIAGVTAAPEWYWIYVPWSWPTRLMCPIIGVHPNGVPLETSSTLMDFIVIPEGIFLSIVTLIILTIITSIWFSRRELK